MIPNFDDSGRLPPGIHPAELNENLLKSSRNIQRVALTRASDLNTYQIMQTQSLVLSEGSVAKIQEMFN